MDGGPVSEGPQAPGVAVGEVDAVEELGGEQAQRLAARSRTRGCAGVFSYRQTIRARTSRTVESRATTAAVALDQRHGGRAV